MDISSSLSGAKEFRIVKRGYDPDEVDTFLDQIALGVAELKRKVAESDDRIRQPAAGATAEPTSEDTPDELHRVLILAQRAADEEVRKATEEGQRIMDDARAHAEELHSEAEGEVAERREEGRAALMAEIVELEGVRGALSNDVVVLERHVEEQREVVQAAISELQSLLDHPEAFRIAAASGVSSVSAPAPEPFVEDAEQDARVDGPLDGPPPAPPSPSDEPADSMAGDPGAQWSRLSSPDATAGPSDRPAAVPSESAEGDTTVGGFTEDEESDADVPASAELLGGSEADGDDRSTGPVTEALPAVEPEADPDPDEDAFLAELRKAMLDDEPLGPRDAPAAPPSTGFETEAARGGRPRFGRRR